MKLYAGYARPPTRVVLEPLQCHPSSCEAVEPVVLYFVR